MANFLLQLSLTLHQATQVKSWWLQRALAWSSAVWVSAIAPVSASVEVANATLLTESIDTRSDSLKSVLSVAALARLVDSPQEIAPDPSSTELLIASPENFNPGLRLRTLFG